MNLQLRRDDDPEYCYDCNEQATRCLHMKSGRVGLCDPCTAALCLEVKNITVVGLAGGKLS